MRRLLGGSRGLPRVPRPLDDAFEPAGLLERALVEHAAGRIDLETVLRLFARSRVFVPSQDEALDATEGAPFRPVLLDAGGSAVVATCTSAARLRGLLRAVPHVTSGIEVEAAWVIEHAAGELGVVVNPGWSVALVIAAGDLARRPG